MRKIPPQVARERVVAYACKQLQLNPAAISRTTRIPYSRTRKILAEEGFPMKAKGKMPLDVRSGRETLALAAAQLVRSILNASGPQERKAILELIES